MKLRIPNLILALALLSALGYQSTARANITFFPYDFTGSTSDGGNPVGNILPGPDGYLYGVTTHGGTNSHGTVFKVKWDFTGFQVLHNFGGTIFLPNGQRAPDGTSPTGGLVLDKNGLLWGTTAISVAQSPGAPTLYISHSGSMVTVYWQDVSGWTLQQNNNLAIPANWSASGGVSTANGTNSITITSPTGNLFFRLYQP